MRPLVRTLLAAAVLLVGASRTSLGAIAYGVTLIGNQLITLDSTNGSASLVGSLTGNVAPYGLAGFNNQLYTYDSTASVIHQISTATGATVNTFDVGIGPVIGQGGLAFQSSTVGFLTTALDPTTFEAANNLYRFDLSTGTSSLISHTAAALSSIAFAANGTLYGLGKLDATINGGAASSDNLYTIDPTTGAMTLIGNVGVALGSPVASLTVGTDGTLFATLDDTLYSLSARTGLATAIGNPVTQSGFASISGIAFTNGIVPAAVPEPSSLALCSIAALAGLVAARRGRA